MLPNISGLQHFVRIEIVIVMPRSCAVAAVAIWLNPKPLEDAKWLFFGNETQKTPKKI